MRLRNLFRPLCIAGRIQNWLYKKRHSAHTFETGIRETVKWYLEHQDWMNAGTASK
jgi:dTDP-D-glucose 4,6-dehydratase